VVLILGHFTSDRKIVLDAVTDTLSKEDYLPVLFDVNKPSTYNLTETVRTLAHLLQLILVDLASPQHVLRELQPMVPNLTPVARPLLARPMLRSEYAQDAHEPGLSDEQAKHPLVLDIHQYQDLEDLLGSLKVIIAKAEARKARHRQEG